MGTSGIVKDPLKQIERWPTLRSKDWCVTFLRSAEKNENVLSVVAVGSAVRESVRSVDLDLLVMCREPKELKVKAPIELDLRIYAEGSIDKLLEDGNDYLSWSLKFGRVLFQREHFWDRILNSWSRRTPFPSFEVAKQRAESAYARYRKVLELGDRDAAFEQALSYATHKARAALIEKGVYPTSRPELPDQLRSADCPDLANVLDRLLREDNLDLEQLDDLVKGLCC